MHLRLQDMLYEFEYVAVSSTDPSMTSSNQATAAEFVVDGGTDASAIPASASAMQLFQTLTETQLPGIQLSNKGSAPGLQTSIAGATAASIDTAVAGSAFGMMRSVAAENPSRTFTGVDDASVAGGLHITASAGAEAGDAFGTAIYGNAMMQPR